MTKGTRTALANAKAERRKKIVRQLQHGIKGEPLDAENPMGDLWLVAAFAIVPLGIIVLEVVA